MRILFTHPKKKKKKKKKVMIVVNILFGQAIILVINPTWPKNITPKSFKSCLLQIL